MTSVKINEIEYRMAGMLSPFQLEMYAHLIEWKWEHVTREPGNFGKAVYDTMFPEELAHKFPMIYPGVVGKLKEHLVKFPFRIHRYFDHVASSQAANINLFLPLLQSPNSSAVFSQLKPDFARLAADQLDGGFRIEFWDEGFGSLNDKSKVAGTDTDIAIAYYNHQNELCLWLIEHKLTEKEFTTCGGAKSPSKKTCHDCSKSFTDILANKDLCFYHNNCKYNYWKITEANLKFFANHSQYEHCPFREGMNQLWRNQLLALSIERDERQPYRHVTFSVVKHPKNTQLDATLEAYLHLIDNHPSFSVYTSADFISAASALNDSHLDEWIGWYKALYNL